MVDQPGGLRDALIAFQADMPAVKKSGFNPYFRSKYSTLQDVIDCVKLGSAFGLGFTQRVDFESDRIFVWTVLFHACGEKIESRTPVQCKADRDPQAMGSGITYARRYGLQAIYGLAAEDDDDGNAGAGRSVKGHVDRVADAQPTGDLPGQICEYLRSATTMDRLNEVWARRNAVISQLDDFDKKVTLRSYEDALKRIGGG